MNGIKKRLALLGCASVLTTIGLVAATEVAGVTHADDVKGEAVCNTETGKFDITWTITNDHPLPQTATSRLGTVNIAPNGSAPQSESVSAGTYELAVHGKWSDGFEGDAKGSVTTSGDCTIPPPPHDECPNIPDNQPVGYDCTPETETPPTEEPPVVAPPVDEPKKPVVPKTTTHKEDSGLPNTGA